MISSQEITSLLAAKKQSLKQLQINQEREQTNQSISDVDFAKYKFTQRMLIVAKQIKQLSELDTLLKSHPNNFQIPFDKIYDANTICEINKSITRLKNEKLKVEHKIANAIPRAIRIEDTPTTVVNDIKINIGNSLKDTQVLLTFNDIGKDNLIKYFTDRKVHEYLILPQQVYFEQQTDDEFIVRTELSPNYADKINSDYSKVQTNNPLSFFENNSAGEEKSKIEACSSYSTVASPRV